MAIDYHTLPARVLLAMLETAGRAPDLDLIRACLERRTEITPGLLDSLAAILDDDPQRVIDFESLGDAARLAVPTPDHFWPLLYVLGARQPGDRPVFEPDFIQYATIDMTTVSLRDDIAP